MLSILVEDWENYGCPNCGCDAITPSGVTAVGKTSGTCKYCGLNFEIHCKGKYLGGIKYRAHPANPSVPKSTYIQESAIKIPHPRKGIDKWHWEPKDERPKEGEYWSSRGYGDNIDIAGFVKTKQSGERILELVKDVLNTDNPESWLDYRPSEPSWIQFKFSGKEFDLERLDRMTRDTKVLTKEILQECTLE